MKMFLTRIGFGSVAVVTGDMTQIDLPKHQKSGLRDAIEVLRGVDGISFTFFRRVTWSAIRWWPASCAPTRPATRATAQTGFARIARMSRGPPPACEVSVHTACPRRGVPAAVSFRTWVAAALDGAHAAQADLAIRLVDCRRGPRAQRHYRGKDYATNVLSFPAELPGLPRTSAAVAGRPGYLRAGGRPRGPRTGQAAARDTRPT